jgi:hypothetical protein
MSVPSTVKCSCDIRPCARACSTTFWKKRKCTSPSRSLSRFLLNTVTFQTASSVFNPTNQRNSRL